MSQELLPQLTPQQQYELDYPEEIRKNLKFIVEDLEKEQQPIREYYIKEWKRNDYYWRNIFDLFWDEVSRDWRPYEEGIRNNPELEIDPDDTGRAIGIYRAHGESIIAALSTGIPGIRFAPDDADNPDDISTAKAYSKISDLIDNHNNAKSLIVKTLFILWNQPAAFIYNYHNTDPSYGMIKIPKQETVMEEKEVYNCPECLGEMENGEPQDCPTCGAETLPEAGVQEVPVTIETYENSPKGREILEVYGPMNVKVPFYASDLKNCPYLILESEHHYALARDLFPQIKDKIKPSNSRESYDRWARTPSDKYYSSDSDVVTIRRCWLRPWAYNLLENDEEIEDLKEKYPNGCYAIFVDDVFAEAVDENMDDHWTVSISPTSNHIHDVPMGRPLVDVQEMTNEMVNLVLRTIKHGIPITFADSDAIDWDKFKDNPSEPGDIIPTRPARSGQNMAGRFHTVKTATLAQEVGEFTSYLQGQGQFVSKAFPSIYGGPQTSGSKTYKEYEMSRNQALQALSLTWQNLNVLWKDAKFKACKEYARNMQADEQFSQKEGTSFVNVWIRRSEMTGKVGSVEPEASDQFPISSQQKRGLLIELMGMNNEYINQAIFHIENAEKNSRLLSFDELYIPGVDQKNKQVRETFELMKGQPTPTGQPDPNDPTGTAELMTSSVPIEEFDDHNIHMQCTAAFLVSDLGQELKMSNPPAYQNIALHYREHAQAQAQIDQQNFMAQLEQQKMINSAGKPPNNQVDDGSEAKESQGV